MNTFTYMYLDSICTVHVYTTTVRISIYVFPYIPISSTRREIKNTRHRRFATELIQIFRKYVESENSYIRVYVLSVKRFLCTVLLLTTARTTYANVMVSASLTPAFFVLQPCDCRWSRCFMVSEFGIQSLELERVLLRIFRADRARKNSKILSTIRESNTIGIRRLVVN